MTRLHFKVLAEEIARMPGSDECRRQAALAVAKACQRFNPAFDKWKFLEACGVEE